jgi:hypothetical protein
MESESERNGEEGMAKSKTGWSERVREVAKREYIEPARATQGVVRIPFGELKSKLVRLGFPQSHANQVATPLETDKFWKPLGLELCSPKGQARTVDSVLVFRFAAGERTKQVYVKETPAEKASRLIGQMRGLMKNTIDSHGGAEAFIRWVRSDSDEDSA